MSDIDRIRRKIKAKNKPVEFKAVLGRADGTVQYDSQNVYVTLYNGDVQIVHNSRLPLYPYRKIIIGYDDKNPELLQVLRFDKVYKSIPVPEIPNHKDSHKWHGHDPAEIDLPNITPLLPRAIGGFVIRVFSGDYVANDIPCLLPTTDFDLTAEAPGSGAEWVSCFLDENQAATYVHGTNKASRELLLPADKVLVSGTKRLLFAVKMYQGQTDFIQTRTRSDIFDPRLSITTGSMPALALDDLIDVDAPTPNEGDVLVFDACAGEWIPGSSGLVTAALVGFTPSGNIAATNVQAALEEVDSEKQIIAHSHTGTTDSPKLVQANTHESPDTDSATSSLHHTLGTGANQAAAGNHTHAGGSGDKYPFEARLTLETGVPVSTADQTAKTTLYLTKYNGDQIAVFDAGGAVSSLALGADISASLAGLGRSQAYTNDPAAGSSITLNMTDTTGFLVGDIVKVSSSAGSEEAVITAVVANTSITVNTLALNHTTTTPLVTGRLPYDVFVYNNAGTLTLELLAWTNNTTRATALTTQNGVQVKTGDITRRYAGTICTTTTIGQCEISFGQTSAAGGSKPELGVYNEYNQVEAEFKSLDSTYSWAYTTRAWRAKNAAVANGLKNQFRFVNGGRSIISGTVLGIGGATATGKLMLVGIGYNSVTVRNGLTGYTNSYVANFGNPVSTPFSITAVIGGGYLQELEYGDAGVTFYGNVGAPTVYQTGAVYKCRM